MHTPAAVQDTRVTQGPGATSHEPPQGCCWREHRHCKQDGSPASYRPMQPPPLAELPHGPGAARTEGPSSPHLPAEAPRGTGGSRVPLPAPPSAPAPTCTSDGRRAHPARCPREHPVGPALPSASGLGELQLTLPGAPCVRAPFSLRSIHSFSRSFPLRPLISPDSDLSGLLPSSLISFSTPRSPLRPQAPHRRARHRAHAASSPTTRDAPSEPTKGSVSPPARPRAEDPAPGAAPAGPLPRRPPGPPEPNPHRTREPRWPPAWPSCQGRRLYFKSCTQCPSPEDAGTGPAARVTPGQLHPRGAEPAPAAGRAVGQGDGAARSAGSGSSAEGTLAPRAPPPPPRPQDGLSRHSRLSSPRVSLGFSQQDFFTSVRLGLLNFYSIGP
ncbi:basic proline-rich protein-like [Saccopteryx leptura]|uniref:basic proline-rich protein-like n=1 Tax=Saccopteryx leptura TaxID=249018 RepID=UPI00339C68FC